MDYEHLRIEHVAMRNFNLGDRVRSYFNGEWVLGTVVEKYTQEGYYSPFVLVKTDMLVDGESTDAFLDGFGLEYEVTSPRIMFAHEPKEGMELYRRTYTRRMTAEEIKEYDSIPF